MGYVRDDRTGKFSWVEGAMPDGGEGPYVPPGQRPQREISPAVVLTALLIVGVVAAVVLWSLQSLKDPSVAIRRIHNHPAEFDGHQVTVNGRVGEVFEVGGGYAYYLLQGRDTIAVFTRGSRPTPGGHTRVHGSVSIGYLDGAPRPALFATSGSD